MTHFNVKVEGLNGQLPNLDLVNLVNRLCVRERVPQMFQNTEDHPRLGQEQDLLSPAYWRSLRTFVSMILSQASGVPSGNHGLFHRFGIEALTLQGVKSKARKKATEVSMNTMGRVVEGVFRSLNNLLERFHQSFFFYLLPSSNRYVSIGRYMIPFGCLGGALVIAALGLWFRCTREEQLDRAIEERDRLRRAKKKDAKEEAEFEEVVTLPVVIPASLASVVPVVVFAHGIGLLLTVLPDHVTRIGAAALNVETDEALLKGLLAFCLVVLALPKYFGGRAIVVDAKNWRVLKCITLLELAAFAFVVSLSNFSLAYVISLVYVPFALLVGDNRKGSSSLKWLLKLCLSLASHPMAMLAITCTINTVANFVAERPSLWHLVPMCYDATKRALTYAVTDSMIFGHVSYSMACLVLMPCWFLLWCQNFVTAAEERDDVGESPKTPTAEEDKKNK